MIQIQNRNIRLCSITEILNSIDKYRNHTIIFILLVILYLFFNTCNIVEKT